MSLIHLLKTTLSLRAGITQLITSRLPAVISSNTATIHTTQKCFDLMEFFDAKKNWGENEIKVGRAWGKDELRIKSNTDLHKLWYILLKEKNMLMTMEHECNEKMELFPSPERIDKVNLSMENIELVIRERNKAYHLLETGETGEQKKYRKENQLGVKFNYAETEHLIPQELNRKWQEKFNQKPRGHAVHKFLLMHREQMYNVKRKKANRDRNEVMHYLRRNPSLDKSVLAAKYPNVNIDRLIFTNKVRGHYVPE